MLAFPLLPFLGVTATFNVIFLAITALTAWAMYLLARRVRRAVARSVAGGSAVRLFAGARRAQHRAFQPGCGGAAAGLRALPDAARREADDAQRGGRRCDHRVGRHLRSVLRRLLSPHRRLLRERSGSCGFDGARRRPPRTLDSAARSTWRSPRRSWLSSASHSSSNLTGVTEVRPFGLRIELSMHAPVVVLMVLVIAARRRADAARGRNPVADAAGRVPSARRRGGGGGHGPSFSGLVHVVRPPGRRRRAARRRFTGAAARRALTCSRCSRRIRRTSCSARRRVPG